MPEFENPPSQRLSELYGLRTKLIELIDAHNGVLLDYIRPVLERPTRYWTDTRASAAAQVAAHELTVARLDREIARLESEIRDPDVSDPAPRPEWLRLPNPSKLAPGNPA